MQTLLILVFIPFILADVNKFMFQGQSPLSLNSLNPGNKIMNEHSVAEPGLIGPYSTLYNLTMDVIQHGQNKFAGIDPSILIPIQNILSDSDYEIKISFPSWVSDLRILFFSIVTTFRLRANLVLNLSGFIPLTK